MRVLAYLCVAFSFASTAVALADPDHASWFARTWQTEDGLPNDNVNGLAQSPDGFLWIATPVGLARFDGVAFDDISLTTFVGSANRGVAALLQSPSGGLWVGMDRGAIVDLNERQVTTFTPTNTPLDSAAQTMVEGDNGAVWISYVGGSVCCLKDGKTTVLSTQMGLPWSSVS